MRRWLPFFFFKPLSFGIMYYVVIDNQNNQPPDLLFAQTGEGLECWSREQCFWRELGGVIGTWERLGRALLRSWLSVD